jgi:hypothetical protein
MHFRLRPERRFRNDSGIGFRGPVFRESVSSYRFTVPVESREVASLLEF